MADKNPDFKEGDVVVLKSGSQKMTIDEIKDDKATCYWFVAGEEKSGTYKLSSLTYPTKRSNQGFI